MSDEIKLVIITDIRMRFWSMVWFMVKWVIASIPAIIILATILIVVAAGFAALTGFGGTPF